MLMTEDIDDVPGIQCAFRAYGDNIAETELIIDWLLSQEPLTLEAVIGTLDQPTYLLSDSTADATFAVQLCPGYERWDYAPLENRFAEHPDIVLTYLGKSSEEIEDTEETEVFAFENSGATQVGNQAQQRFRRANDAAVEGIPYIYQIDLVGIEDEDSSGKIKSPHYQKPRITIGHLSLMSQLGVPSFIVFKTDMWAQHPEVNEEKIPATSEFNGTTSAPTYLTSVVRKTMISESVISDPELKSKVEEQQESSIEGILSDMFNVARFYVESDGSSSSSTEHTLYTNHPSFNEPIDDVVSEYASSLSNQDPVSDPFALHTIDTEYFKKNGSLFRKVVRGDTEQNKFKNKILPCLNSADYNSNKKSPEDIQEFLEFWGVSPESGFNFEWPRTLEHVRNDLRNNKGKIPVTYKSGKSEFLLTTNRKSIRKLIEENYDNISDSVLDWIWADNKDNSHIMIAPFSGLQNSGYSDPDTGLPPLMNALFPKLVTKPNTLVIVYSEHISEEWRDRLRNESNMLWKSISKYAGCVIADKMETGEVLHD